MCPNPFDCQYAAYGSRLPRADMTHGRVGSILENAAAGVVTTEPMVQEDAAPFDGSENYESPTGPSSNEDDAVYGVLPPVNNGSSPAYGTDPDTDSSLEELPAADQIERVYDAINGEIGQ